MSRLSPLVSLLCLAALPLAAQQRIAMPRIEIRQEDRSRPARLKDLRIDVKVVGHVATTTWEMTLHNPQDRVLEGELDFPLGEGQTISRFAMDVNGRLREGVPVEKAKGRIAFESTVRQNVDPGLLERTAGNSFRARVYPIPARGHKRVVVAYEQTLSDAGARELLYTLPLDFQDKVDTFSLRVEVLDQGEAPRLASSPLATFAFKPFQRAFVAEETRRDFAPDRPLSVAIPRPADSAQVFVEQRNGADYFQVMVHPPRSREAKVLPRTLLVLWDASASGRKRDLKRELDLLEAYLRRIGTCRVRLAIFRDTASFEELHVKDGDARALRTPLEREPMDGATALGRVALPPAMRSGVDETLLFSDGLNTLGVPEAGLPQAPLVAVNSAPAAESARLRVLAESRGGEYLDLRQMGQDAALQALATRPLSFLRATCESGSVEQLYPSASRVVRGPFSLAGILKAPKVRLTLHFGHGRTTRFTRSVDIDAAQARVQAPVARLWAQAKLEELELDPGRNDKAILALGQAHGLVTANTSLIILDDVADYVRHRIQPPEELREEYERRVVSEKDGREQEEKRHLADLLAQFQERRQWWETVFKPVEPVKPAAVGAQVSAASQVAGSPATMPALDRSITGAANLTPGVAAPSPRQEMALRSPGGSDRAVGAAVEVLASSGAVAEDEGSASITLKPWSPDTPYLKALKAVPREERYALYLKLRDEYGGTPGFYLDVSDLFREQGQEALALRVLSNLAELKLEDAPLLRVLGYRLRQLGQHALAVWVFEEVLRLREEEPQSRRDLALACLDAGQHQRALDLLWEVARRPWDGRFQDVSLIALGELNALLATGPKGLDASRVDRRLLASMPVDIRVVLNWDTDNSDMDLHVVDPRGETCFFSHPRTAIGGRISRDVTGGYGPEEFLLRRAIPGTYQVKANFFGTRQQTAVGATTVVLELYLRYGTGRMENRSITLRLEGQGGMRDIGSFQFGEAGKPAATTEGKAK